MESTVEEFCYKFSEEYSENLYNDPQIQKAYKRYDIIFKEIEDALPNDKKFLLGELEKANANKNDFLEKKTVRTIKKFLDTFIEIF